MWDRGHPRQLSGIRSGFSETSRRGTPSPPGRASGSRRVETPSSGSPVSGRSSGSCNPSYAGGRALSESSPRRSDGRAASARVRIPRRRGSAESRGAGCPLEAGAPRERDPGRAPRDRGDDRPRPRKRSGDSSSERWLSLTSPASSSRSRHLGGGTRARRPAASQSGPRSSSGSESPSHRGSRSLDLVTRVRNNGSPRRDRATAAGLCFGARNSVSTWNLDDSRVRTGQARLSAESSGPFPVECSELRAVVRSVQEEVEEVVQSRGNGLSKLENGQPGAAASCAGAAASERLPTHSSTRLQ